MTNSKAAPCNLCKRLPLVPAPVDGGDHKHYQIICIDCGVEVVRLSWEECRDTWNGLMVGASAARARVEEE